MAETLQNINSFLAAVSYQSSKNINDTPTYVKETVVIDKDTRDYNNEIHLTNSDNTYVGTFYALDNSESVNILDVAKVGVSIAPKIDELSSNIANTENRVINTINNVSAEVYTKSVEKAAENTNTAINIAISTKYDNIDTQIITTNTALQNHIDNGDVTAQHVTKNGELQIGLNAEKLGGKTQDEIINIASESAKTTLSLIDCGRI